MAVRRFTVGRALVLLVVGIGIGVGMFVFKHLRPEELQRRVREALQGIIAADFRFGAAELNLNKGLDVSDLEILYPDRTVALAARRISVTIDQAALLRGETIIREVELSGVTVRLRPNPQNIPALPGIFKPRRPDEPGAEPVPFPIIVRGSNDPGWESRVLVQRWPTREQAVAVELICEHLELTPQGDRYELNAEFSGERVDRIALDGSFDAVSKSLRINQATIHGLSWGREHTRRLAQLLPDDERPPILLGGVADLELVQPLEIRRPADLLEMEARASLRDLDGRFGNLYTFQAHGLPFRIGSGRCDVEFRNRRLEISHLGARFSERAGDRGRVTAAYARDYGRPGVWEDWTLTGRDVHTTPTHLAILLPSDIAGKIVGPFSPGGTFDFEVSVSNRPGFPEKVNADVRLRDGRFEYDEFQYPLDACRAHIHVETNVASPRGPSDVIDFTLQRGPDVWNFPDLDADTVSVRARGRITTYTRPYAPEDNPEVLNVTVRVANMPFDERLDRALDSTGMQRDAAYYAFQLGGSAHRVEVEFASDDFGGRPDGTTYTVQLQDCTAAYRAFPLPLVGLAGTIIKRTNPAISEQDGRRLPELEFVNLRARAREGGEIGAHGEMRDGELDLIVEAKRLTLGDDLARTLRQVSRPGEGIGDLWERLRPSGSVDADIHYDSREEDDLTVWVDLAGRTSIAGYDGFALPVTGIAGNIFYRTDRLELTSIHGRLGDATINLDGFHEGRDRILNLYGVVAGPIESDLLRGINRALAGTTVIPEGFRLKPQSRFRYELWSSGATDRSEPVLRAELSELELSADIRQMPLELRGGRVRIGPDRIRFGNMLITHQGSPARLEILDGLYPLVEGERPKVELRAEQIQPRIHLSPFLGDGLARFLGPGALVDLPMLELEYIEQSASVKLTGTVDLHREDGAREDPGAGLAPTGIVTLRGAILEPEPPRGGPPLLSGEIGFRDLNFTTGWAPEDMTGVLHIEHCRLAEGFLLKGRISEGEAKLLDFFVEQLQLDIEYELDNLRLSRIDGVFHEGRLKGEIALHGTDPGAYQVEIEATGVDLRKMLAKLIARDEPISGLLDLKLEVHSLSGHLRDQMGFVSVDVKKGQLIEVPGIRKVISLLSRATPFGNAGSRFKTATVRARIRGETLRIDQLHFSTATNDIHIKGTMSIFGDLDLVVKPQVTRLIDLPRLINIPILSKLLDLWHKIAYEIRLEGTLGSPALRLRALPWLHKHRQPFIQSPHAGGVKRMRPEILP